MYAKKTGPLMAEITLTSSHEPWTPIPQTVDWDQVGDGASTADGRRAPKAATSLWEPRPAPRPQYAKSIAYSVDSLVSWAQKYGDDNLVLVMFGDHQPMSIVSGNGASHDIPITIIAHDQTVLDRIADWNWADGLRARPQRPGLADGPSSATSSSPPTGTRTRSRSPRRTDRLGRLLDHAVPAVA